MDAEKLSAIRFANAASGSLENSSSVLISEISGKKSSSGLVTPEASLRPGEFFAVKDVSFELRRGGIEDPGTVRKRDFGEMPWCNQGAELREETASMSGADWS